MNEWQPTRVWLWGFQAQKLRNYLDGTGVGRFIPVVAEVLFRIMNIFE